MMMEEIISKFPQMEVNGVYLGARRSEIPLMHDPTPKEFFHADGTPMSYEFWRK